MKREEPNCFWIMKAGREEERERAKVALQRENIREKRKTNPEIELEEPTNC